MLSAFIFLRFLCVSITEAENANVTNSKITVDGNSGISGVGDGEGDEVTVGVVIGVGVGVLPTLKVAVAVATVAPLEASIAAALVS